MVLKEMCIRDSLTLFYNGNAASQEEYDRNVGGYFSDSLLAEISRDIYAEYVK